MAPIVAPSVARFTVVGALFGEECMNIFDVSITDEGIGTSRNDAIALVAGDLLNQWSDHVLPLLTTAYQAIEVRWVDLDSASGGTGSITSTDGSTWPEEGGTAGPPLPNNCYAKVVKNLEGKTRTQRNGVLRLGGLLESMTETGQGNTLTAATQLAISSAFEDLKDGINGGAGDYTANLVVVHTVDDAYDGESDIATYACQPVIGTIRRRMPGYGD